MAELPRLKSVGLESILSGLDIITNRDVLVGFDTRDDAGVFRINKDQAIVVTADFITPPPDDPYIFGQIAAANSSVHLCYGRISHDMFKPNVSSN